LKDGDSTILAVIIENIRPATTKNNETMAFLTLSDFSDSIEAVVFPRTYREFRETLQADACLAIKATLNTRNGEKSLIVERIKRI
jgi:DNA polymerase III subunit alpha